MVEKPGLRSLLVEGTRTDGLEGRTLVRVEPSQKYPPAGYIEITDDILPTADHASDATGYFMTLMQAEWERLQREAHTLATTLLARSRVESE